MNGCRALTDHEIERLKSHIANPRDYALFVLGLRSGFRVSELVSLKVCDLIEFGEVSESVTVQRKSMKGKQSGRTVRLHAEAKSAILQLIKH